MDESELNTPPTRGRGGRGRGRGRGAGRGRKKVSEAVPEVQSTMIEETLIGAKGESSSQAENVILHLSGNACGTVLPDPGAYNAVENDAFTSGLYDISSESNRIQNVPAADIADIEMQRMNDISDIGSVCGGGNPPMVNLLSEFYEKSKVKEWPLSTSVCCHWCCHPFDTTPIGLPVRYSNGVFHVIRCFCSLNCAMAFNLSSPRGSIDEKLICCSMINDLASRLGYGNIQVQPAPDKFALRAFGGNMSIEEFREYSVNESTHLIINNPPMQSQKEQLEEVNNSDLMSEYRYIPIDKERVNKYQNKMRLMRTKPLVDFTNTLDHSMKLKYTN